MVSLASRRSLFVAAVLFLALHATGTTADADELTVRARVPMIAADVAGVDGPGPEPGPLPPGTLRAAVEPFVAGFIQPIFVTHSGDGSGNLFVVERGGTIRVLAPGAEGPALFLDLPQDAPPTSERGLLGLAFHPSYPDDPRFFVFYTDVDGTITISSFEVTDNPLVADPGSELPLLTVPHPERGNHNGGMIAFGADGYLYIATGDGGFQRDSEGNAQDLAVGLGKLLRIDVDGDEPYEIPPGNPYASVAGARPEIWASGLRNPWKFSFDRLTGDLWLPDVGETMREEMNVESNGHAGGQNYGWNVMEGSLCFEPADGCDMTGLALPDFEYTHDDGCSVIGGYVYRGAAYPALNGYYVFTDYCGAGLRTLVPVGGAYRHEVIGDSPTFSVSFGEDEAGELYLVHEQQGAVYKIVPAVD